jgi:hypothetical protein
MGGEKKGRFSVRSWDMIVRKKAYRGSRLLEGEGEGEFKKKRVGDLCLSCLRR